MRHSFHIFNSCTKIFPKSNISNDYAKIPSYLIRPYLNPCNSCILNNLFPVFIYIIYNFVYNYRNIHYVRLF